ncbi:hypothetical protein [Deinococcus phoenicis]|uniref:hypothetical protein n=1 Tax=Deinococcus phoenicis TaxID=1476583 RepID=UPI00054E6CD0|nr:hypothetical protein [Deinococcus phoenicis]
MTGNQRRQFSQLGKKEPLERIADALERIAGFMADDAAERANAKRAAERAVAEAKQRGEEEQKRNSAALSAVADAQVEMFRELGLSGEDEPGGGSFR